MRQSILNGFVVPLETSEMTHFGTGMGYVAYDAPHSPDVFTMFKGLFSLHLKSKCQLLSILLLCEIVFSLKILVVNNVFLNFIRH